MQKTLHNVLDEFQIGVIHFVSIWVLVYRIHIGSGVKGDYGTIYSLSGNSSNVAQFCVRLIRSRYSSFVCIWTFWISRMSHNILFVWSKGDNFFRSLMDVVTLLDHRQNSNLFFPSLTAKPTTQSIKSVATERAHWRTSALSNDSVQMSLNAVITICFDKMFASTHTGYSMLISRPTWDSTFP